MTRYLGVATDDMSAESLRSQLADNSLTSSGAARVGYDGETVESALDKAKAFPSYAELRAYRGMAEVIHITNPGIEGFFQEVGSTTPVDDGGTLIVDAVGRSWQRTYEDENVYLSWWGATENVDVSSSMTKALALNKQVVIPSGTMIMSVSLPTGATVIGQGKGKTLIKPPAGNTSNVFNLSGVNSVRLIGFKIQGSATAKEGETIGLINCTNGFYNVHMRDLEVIQGSQCGIVLRGGAESNERSTIIDCAIYSNRYDGIQISETKHVDVIQSQIHDNAHHGIALQPAAWPITAYAVDDISIDSNRVYNNVGHGIYVLPLIFGGTSLTSFTYSFTEQQYCKDVRVLNNHVYSNSATGIMAGGYNCTYTSNTCINNGTTDGYSGIVVAGYALSVSGNVCTGNSTYGIDIGGSLYSTITGNTCEYNAVGKSFCIGMNLGASVGCTVTGNTIANNGSNDANTFQMMIAGWDGDGLYSYELGGGYNIVTGNTIRSFSNNYGIYIRHNVEYTQVSSNYLSQGSRTNAIVNETDYTSGTNTIINNFHDISNVPGGVTIASAASLVLDDFNSEYIVTGTTAITSITTKSNSDAAGKVVAARITAKGSGYTSKPTVTISGGGGTGATATAEIGRGGQVLGINFTNGGSGYTSNPTITFTGGGGTGAAATAVFGLKNHAGRRITLQFEGAATVNVPGMNASYTASGGSTLSLEGRKNGNGQWVELSRSA